MPRFCPSKDKEYYLCDVFPKAVTCAVSMRGAGNMSLSSGDTKYAIENRKNFLKQLNIDYRDLVCAEQVHGAKIHYVTEHHKGRGALSYESALGATDALITDKIGIPIGIFTADCLPVFLYDPVVRAMALIHAGWRSNKEEIIIKTVRLMQNLFNSRPQNLTAVLGPVIRSCCYEVSSEFKDFFPRAVSTRNDHYFMDLVLAGRIQLEGAGIDSGNIIDSGLCTCCQNTKFFSYRKESKDSGRMMTVGMLL